MSDISIYKCTPRQVAGFVEECLYAGLVPYVQSSPGMGKSTIMRGIAKKLNLKLIDHRLSTSAPEDLSGLPQFKDGKARFAPFDDLFPIEGTALPDGKDGWMLFLDEFNSAPRGVQAACYKLILDRMTGQFNLHPNTVITAAGNLSTDKAITNPISTAMQSRVVHLEMEINFKEWLEDVAFAENYDSRIVAYLSMHESKLMDFDPNHNEKTFCCPRTWEFVNRLIQGKEITTEKAPLLAGTITSGTAVDFIQFTNVYSQLPTINDVINNPIGCMVPPDTAGRWGMVCRLMEKIDDQNLKSISKYINRYTLDFRVLFYRSILVKHKHLRHHPSFTEAMGEIARYLA